MNFGLNIFLLCEAYYFQFFWDMSFTWRCDQIAELQITLNTQYLYGIEWNSVVEQMSKL